VTARSAVTSQSPSGDLPRRVDAVQAELGEGPCPDAVFDQQTVRVPDMAHEQRWPLSVLTLVLAAVAAVGAFVNLVGLSLVRDVLLGVLFILWAAWWISLLVVLVRQRETA